MTEDHAAFVSGGVEIILTMFEDDVDEVGMEEAVQFLEASRTAYALAIDYVKGHYTPGKGNQR